MGERESRAEKLARLQDELEEFVSGGDTPITMNQLHRMACEESERELRIDRVAQEILHELRLHDVQCGQLTTSLDYVSKQVVRRLVAYGMVAPKPAYCDRGACSNLLGHEGGCTI